MKIHKEGYKTIAITALFFGGVNVLNFIFLSANYPKIAALIFVLTFLLLLFILSFFRIPIRESAIEENEIVCPADGKVVVIEEIMELEYFNDKRIQVSIFMSPANVHVNLNPISGVVKYSQYHAGKYLVAWHPKSSLENERHTTVIENENGILLVKQIAGALAKRIINYLAVGQQIKQGGEMGFIKFGSRVDVLLPLSCTLQVKLNEAVKGGVTVLATW